MSKPRGLRFYLPPGYSLATLPGKRYQFVRADPPHASEPGSDPEAVTRAAWAHAGLPAPVRIVRPVR